MKLRILFVAAAATWLAAAPCAQAAVVTFEPDDFEVVLDNGATHTVQGYDFTLLAGNTDAFFVSGLYAPDDYVNSGSKNLFAANYASLSIAAHDGSSFDLKSFELGGSFIGAPEHWASSVEIVGHTTSGFTLVADAALPSDPTMTLVRLGWTGLTSFELFPNAHAGSIYNDRDYTIDNLDVTAAVPEPQAAALLLGGLGVLAWSARRSRRA